MRNLSCLGLFFVVSALSLACSTQPNEIKLPALPASTKTIDAGIAPGFVCKDATTKACVDNKYVACSQNGEFVEAQADDCGAKGFVCDMTQGCVACTAGMMRCKPCDDGSTTCTGAVQSCDASSRTWVDTQACSDANAEVCRGAQCLNICDVAKMDRSYQGCEFFAVDLDNASISDTLNAAAQQYAVVVANPQPVSVDVWVEKNDAAFGEPPMTSEVERLQVAPGDLEVFKLPGRHVDGSTPTGINDGTNTAVSSNAYRVVSTRPVTAYQFNPLENTNVFSNGASLLLPTSAIGTNYTIASWPQTIARSDDPDTSFDGTTNSDDLRAFLTIAGSTASTHVTMTMGDKVVKVVGAGPIPEAHPGDVLDLDIGPFDVINLETEGFNADFTNSRVTATQPISVFVGSEASDAPVYASYTQRQCCADHLEEQLIPDTALGENFIVAHQPSRTAALNQASQDGQPLVAEIVEPEWIRIVALAGAPTKITTTLPAPYDSFMLDQFNDIILTSTQNFKIQADSPISVVTVLASQQVTGIPSQYPGGDPSLIVVPPTEQYRKDYVFLTPDTYAFNFVAIVAQKDANLLLDGAALPSTCVRSDVADFGSPTTQNPSGTQWVTYGCQLSFPTVTRGPNVSILPGMRNTGSHTLVADSPIGIVVSGFDRFVGYSYVGGLNLDVLN